MDDSMASFSSYAGDDSGVKVCVRVRPLNTREMQHGNRRCVYVDPTQTSITIQGAAEAKQFTFDFVGDSDTPQQDMFERIGQPIVDACLNGYNGTIFAYGQTGSGKTFTMTGLPDDETYRGLIPRVFDALFYQMQQRSMAAKMDDEGNDLSFFCTASYIEIYNETIADLLDASSRNLHIRESVKDGVFVEPLLKQEVSSSDQIMQVLERGSLNRHVSSTDMNDQSSRSHSVFTIYLQSILKSSTGMSTVKHSRLSLIDLAGSERQKNTNAKGDRLKEAGSINRSLTVLGGVINALVENARHRDGERNERHVHYRDSKLTLLLRDSLGGNSKTFIVANISPSDTCYQETISTLKFAQRAKNIRNKPVINEDTTGNMALLSEENRRLKDELLLMRQRLSASSSSGLSSGASRMGPGGFIGSAASLSSHHIRSGAQAICSNDELRSRLEAAVAHFCETKGKIETNMKRIEEETQNRIGGYQRLVRAYEEHLKVTRMFLKFREYQMQGLDSYYLPSGHPTLFPPMEKVLDYVVERSDGSYELSVQLPELELPEDVSMFDEDVLRSMAASLLSNAHPAAVLREIEVTSLTSEIDDLRRELDEQHQSAREDHILRTMEVLQGLAQQLKFTVDEKNVCKKQVEMLIAASRKNAAESSQKMESAHADRSRIESELDAERKDRVVSEELIRNKYKTKARARKIEVTELRREMDHLNAKLKDVASSSQNSSQLLASQIDEIKDLREQLRKTEERELVAQSALHDRESMVVHLEDRIRDLQRVSIERDNLRKELSTTTAFSNELGSQLAQADAEIQKLQRFKERAEEAESTAITWKLRFEESEERSSRVSQDLRAKIAALDESVSRLQYELDNAASQLESANEAQELEAQIAQEKSAACTKLESELAAARSSIEMLEQRCRELAISSSASAGNQDRALREINERCSALMREVSEHKTQYADLQTRFNEIEGQNLLLRSRVSDKESALVRAEAALSQAVDDRDSTISQLQKELETLKQESSEERLEYSDQISKLEADVSEYDEECGKLRKQLAVLQSASSSSSSSSASSASSSSSSSARVAQLERDLMEAQEAVHTLRSDFEAEREIQAAQAAGSVEILEKEIASIRDRLHRTQQQLAAEEQKRIDLEFKLAEAVSNAELQKEEYNDLLDAKGSVDDENNDLRKRVARHQEELASTRARLSELNQEEDEDMSPSPSSQSAKKGRRISSSSSSTAEEDIHMLSSQLTALERAAAQESSFLSSKRTSLASQQHSVSELQGKIRSARTSRTSLCNESEAIRLQVQNDQQKLATLSAEVARKEEEIVQARIRIRELESTSLMKQEDISAAQQAVAGMVVERDQLKRQVEEKRKQSVEHESQLQRLKTELDSQLETIQELQSAKLQVEGEARDLRNQIQEMETKCRESERQASFTAAKLDAVKRLSSAFYEAQEEEEQQSVSSARRASIMSSNLRDALTSAEARLRSAEDELNSAQSSLSMKEVELLGIKNSFVEAIRAVAESAQLLEDYKTSVASSSSSSSRRMSVLASPSRSAPRHLTADSDSSQLLSECVKLALQIRAFPEALKSSSSVDHEEKEVLRQRVNELLSEKSEYVRRYEEEKKKSEDVMKSSNANQKIQLYEEMKKSLHEAERKSVQLQADLRFRTKALERAEAVNKALQAAAAGSEGSAAMLADASERINAESKEMRALGLKAAELAQELESKAKEMAEAQAQLRARNVECESSRSELTALKKDLMRIIRKASSSLGVPAVDVPDAAWLEKHIEKAVSSRPSSASASSSSSSASSFAATPATPSLEPKTPVRSASSRLAAPGSLATRTLSRSALPRQ